MDLYVLGNNPQESGLIFKDYLPVLFVLMSLLMANFY